MNSKMKTKNIHVINPGGFKVIFNELNNNPRSISFLESKDFEIRFTAIDPPDQNYKEKEGFPNCCTFHKNIIKSLQHRIQKFPFCCELHSKLSTQLWFDKINYLGLAEHTAKAVHFTEYQIFSKINEEDWFGYISEYIEYCIYSFGQFPKGFGPPLAREDYLTFVKVLVQGFINEGKYVNERVYKILSFLESFSKKKIEVEAPDIQVLMKYYEEWVKIFPFEISYFEPFKVEFARIYPILNQGTSTNRYMGLQTAQLLTYSQLIDNVVKLTRKILSSYSACQLLEEGRLTDIEFKQLELATSKRRVELEELSTETAKDRNKYIKLIKKWIKYEQKYLQTIAPILSKSQLNSVFIND